MELDRTLPKDQRILLAAEQVFSKHGYERATVDEIIALADVGKGTVYKYFGNKEQLFYKLVSAKNEPFVQDLERAVAGASSLTGKFQAYFTTMLTFYREHASLWQIILNEMVGCKQGCMVTFVDGKPKVSSKYSLALSSELEEQILRYFFLIEKEIDILRGLIREGKNRGLLKSGDMTARTLSLFFGVAMSVFFPHGEIGSLEPEELAKVIVDRFFYGEATKAPIE